MLRVHSDYSCPLMSKVERSGVHRGAKAQVHGAHLCHTLVMYSL